MALFGRESETPQPSPSPISPPRPQPQAQPQVQAQPPAPAKGGAAPRASTATHVGSGARIQGEIGGDTDVVVEGRVEGRVRPERDVTVSEGGAVQGSIEARRVRIAGRVEGNVRGREVVEVLPSGRLIGDVVAPTMVIADGAFFKGSVEMGGAGEPAAQAPSGRAASEKAAP